MTATLDQNKYIFNISCVIDVPQQLAWDMWSDAAELKQWFGPKHCPIFSCSMDLRVGGRFHYGMKTPDGAEMWGKWLFQEIDAPSKMVSIVAFTDASGEAVIRHPYAPTWPLETISEMTFVASGDQTEINIRWQAYNATPLEEATFAAGEDSMRQGWGGTLEGLKEYVAKTK